MANIYIHHQYRYINIIQNENNVLTIFFFLVNTNKWYGTSYIYKTEFVILILESTLHLKDHRTGGYRVSHMLLQANTSYLRQVGKNP